ncbi:uncharacterized protein LOC116424469 [Nomia melanderi]|uniref:uncharacterized protein LOC116424469 n=1 Tax=Nomia melanderi TaxID=2448451 RepID=UPI0013041393|nr:uncharacterized protein LOC116424469 [Nomia melanderi]XP_031826763.1 uncharacterized protein LOC116424469 [Nomia melanderi]XP_031826764.1 uncharacterized protein LOC116424469 [Nomia melanderi]XP_031826765.1 uncharacterized protein LOC116424469 [Nomia melanderi]XP_031826766.1 uncharacterized protein LOC116424469 [Nomia melanderi]XP_031826767.1 uncharacterized protein LOC116424469 [Nomia melanderi]
MRILGLAVGLLIMGPTIEGMNMPEVECGGKYCTSKEYCNKYNNRCQSCSSICTNGSSNYLPKECAIHCQEYLLDLRYVLMEEYKNLQNEVGRLSILAMVAIAVALLSLSTMAYLLASSLFKWRTMRGAFRGTFPATWLKNNTGNKNNNNNLENNNKSSDDVEAAACRRNGPRLAMPTISATVAPARIPVNGKENGSGAGNGNGQGRGQPRENAGTCDAIDNDTPNTTSTSLSGRHPSEDTTLDYAYDNPAMTPSPESVQIRTNRESSF